MTPGPIWLFCPAAVMSTVAGAYSVVAALCARMWVTANATSRAGSADPRSNDGHSTGNAAAALGPPVTLLKPLHGAEPRLYENLVTFCTQDYPEYQLLLGGEFAGRPGGPRGRAAYGGLSRT